MPSRWYTSALSIADLAVASNLVMFRYLGHAAERAVVGTVAGLDPAIGAS